MSSIQDAALFPVSKLLQLFNGKCACNMQDNTYTRKNRCIELMCLYNLTHARK